jgi:hypothetical protein
VAGLISEPQGGMAADDATVPDDAGQAATPEEQEAYDEFVKTAYGMMYEGGEVKPEILKFLDEDPSDLIAVLGSPEELQQFSPIVALAATAAIITLKTCEQTGEKDGTIILHGGQEILEDVAEIARNAGIRDYSEEEMSEAFRMGADLFREAGAEQGIVNLDEAKSEWGEITAADKEGRLGEVIPQFKGMEDQPPPVEEEPVDGAA